MLRTIAIITVLLSEGLTLSAQTDICFTYDAAGNRTIRQLCRVAVNAAGTERAEEPSQALTEAPPKLVILPNPGVGVFRIETVGVPDNALVSIFNLAGDLLVQQMIGEGVFDLTAYPPETYFISVVFNGTRLSALWEKIH